MACATHVHGLLCAARMCPGHRRTGSIVCSIKLRDVSETLSRDHPVCVPKQIAMAGASFASTLAEAVSAPSTNELRALMNAHGSMDNFDLRLQRLVSPHLQHP